jgi:hypothetical protein
VGCPDRDAGPANYHARRGGQAGASMGTGAIGSEAELCGPGARARVVWALRRAEVMALLGGCVAYSLRACSRSFRLGLELGVEGGPSPRALLGRTRSRAVYPSASDPERQDE